MPREEVYGTGKQSIRYAAKVDLSTHAAKQPQLHASTLMDYELDAANAGYRTDGIPIVSRAQTMCSGFTDRAVPFCGTIKNGETVKIECVDWTGGQIKNTDDADDVKNVDLTQIHYLTGPFEIETAEPGDVLVVDIQDVQPLEDHLWGFTGIFDKTNGGGFLDEARLSDITINGQCSR